MGNLKTGLFLGMVLLVGSLMISPESFWVDESTTAQYSQISSLGEFAQTLGSDRNSESQMPLYMLSAWAWGHLVPPTEWALRSSNLIYLIGLFAGALYISRNTRLRLFPWVLIVQPFLWRYVNEFRPYAMQMFFAVWQLAALMDFYEDRNRSGRAGLWIIASWGVCAANMLGVVQTAVTGLAIFVMYVKRRQWPVRSEWIVWSLGVPAFALLGGYFVHTLLAGSGGAKLWTLSPSNLAFALYEMSGAIGLGPSGESLRTAAFSGVGQVLLQFRPFAIPLALFAVTMGGGLAGCVRLSSFPADRNRLFFSGLIFSGGITGICLLAALAGWPFWGRHLASIFPVYVLFVTCLVTMTLSLKWGRPLVAVLFLVIVCSSLSLRLAPRFSRDDYRQAATLARQAENTGSSVWWVAHGPAGRFYGLEFSPDHLIIDATNLKTTEGLLAPETVLMSRPEACDSRGVVRNFLKENRYIQTGKTISGFTVWQKP